jgi:hypothetical protein
MKYVVISSCIIIMCTGTTAGTTFIIIKELYILSAECIYILYVIPIVNIDCIAKCHNMVDLCNRAATCFLCDRN